MERPEERERESRQGGRKAFSGDQYLKTQVPRNTPFGRRTPKKLKIFLRTRKARQVKL